MVSINVRGTLDEPFITLSSEPAMPENEALSYLMTGRSINTLQSGEAASLDRAAQSLAVSGGGLLLGSLGTRYGLDEVTVEQTGDDDTSVVLGKYLSPKLFVSYGISIAEAINTIKLRYTLSERWSLKAEAGLRAERATWSIGSSASRSRSARLRSRQCSSMRATWRGVLRPSDIGGSRPGRRTRRRRSRSCRAPRRR